jgi:transglutaminase-like putative cysteine protease
MFLRVTHLSQYEYSQPVSFAPHALYLRPRENPRQRLHHFTLEISPAARRIATTDPLDNALDWVYFESVAAARLEFRTELMVETLDTNPFDFFLKPSANSFPFTYDDAERFALAPSLAPRADTPAAELRSWLQSRLPTLPAETVPCLTALNAAVHTSLSYASREEAGIQSAGQTLSRGGGSCRDYAVFLIELCRSLGIAARFVSGYLYEPPGASPPAAPALHAWVEVYLPGAGWRGLDPTRGIFCDDAFVPLAHSAIAESVNPIQGSFIGPASVTSKLTTHLKIEKL